MSTLVGVRAIFAVARLPPSRAGSHTLVLRTENHCGSEPARDEALNPPHLFVPQAITHERLALITFEQFGGGIGIAGFHLLLLRGQGFDVRDGRLGFKAVAHEHFALITFEAFCRRVGVAYSHLFLLRCGREALGAEQQADYQQRDTQHHHGVFSLLPRREARPHAGV